jgi:hypothetical protein
MNTPGFTAEVSLYKTTTQYRMTWTVHQADGTVHAAQNGSGDPFCLTRCFRACIEGGGLGFQCIQECRSECGLLPPVCGRCVGFRQCSDGTQKPCSV